MILEKTLIVMIIDLYCNYDIIRNISGNYTLFTLSLKGIIMIIVGFILRLSTPNTGFYPNTLFKYFHISFQILHLLQFGYYTSRPYCDFENIETHFAAQKQYF